MKFLKAFLPHLAIAMLMGLVVLVILDGRNPLMAFRTSGCSKIYMLLMCFLAIGVIVELLSKAEK